MYSLPSTRCVDWSDAGVWYNSGTPSLPKSGTKGIPTYPVGVTINTTNPSDGFYMDPTGTADGTVKLQAAVNACPAGYAVYIPPGTYRITASSNFSGIINVNYTKRIVIRGAGPTLTTLYGYPGSVTSLYGVIRIYGSSSGSVAAQAISSGVAKDSTAFTVASVSGISAGDIITIYPNDIVTECESPTSDVTWYGRRFHQSMTVSSVAGNVINTVEPLYYDISAYSPMLVKYGTYAIGSGVEDLGVQVMSDPGSHAANIKFDAAAHCWAKRVYSYYTRNYHFHVTGSKNCEVRECASQYAYGYAGGQGYGVALENIGSDNLIENNVFLHNRHSVELAYGVSGNVVAYNCGADMENTPAGWVNSDIGNHGRHCYMNLYEGNYTPKINFDYQHGSSSHNTVFRNRAYGTESSSNNGRMAMVLSAWQMYSNLIGNTFGPTSSTGWNGKEPSSYSPVPTYDKWVYMIGMNGDNNLEGWNSNSGDTDLRHGNYDTYSAAVEWNGADDQDLPDSLYLASKPSWFGSLSWPAIGPDVVSYESDTPAKERYDNYVAQGSDDVILLFSDASAGGGEVSVSGSLSSSSSTLAQLSLIRPAAASDYLEDELLDHVFKVGEYTPPTHIYVAICKSTIDDTHTGSTLPGEVSGGGYERTLCDTWAPAVDGATDNENSVVFPKATASWGVVTDVALCDAQTGGNVLVYGKLFNYREVAEGDIMEFESGGLDVTLT